MQKRDARAYTKYLANYAEPEIKRLQFSIDTVYDAFCVLPIFDETLTQLEPFCTHQSNKNIAYVWVINCPDNSNKGAQLRTQQLLKKIGSNHQFEYLTDSLSYAEISPNIDLYLIDRCSSGREIPAKQGVGLARKLGMDLAIYLLNQQEKDTWIHCCDADVILPEHYFNIPPASEGQSAALYSFRHAAEPGYEEAMALYDFKLDYYQSRLLEAGSPYAYHTIGSIIAVTPLAYVQVRGMPKRSGGEDFYFLNKLAKVGDIVPLNEPVLTIAGRPSHRVPFGTGPALVDISKLSDAKQEYRYYHPQIFVALEGLLDVATQAESYLNIEHFYVSLNGVIPGDAEQVHKVLERLGFQAKFKHIQNGRNLEQIKQRFHTWFDAFVTLKFIHHMRDTVYPNLPIDDLPDHVRVGFQNENVHR